MIHQTAHTGVAHRTPDDKLKDMLTSRGYHGDYQQAMQQFIKDRVINGQYTSVFSSYQQELPVDTEQEVPQPHQEPPLQKPWYKRLF